MTPTDPNPDPAGCDAPPQGPVASYALLSPEAKRLYLQFYRNTYKVRGSALDARTKELVAIAASLAHNCSNCLDGHINKALKAGATRQEISEVIEISLGVAAAAIVDRSDLAGQRLGISFHSLPPPS